MPEQAVEAERCAQSVAERSADTEAAVYRRDLGQATAATQRAGDVLARLRSEADSARGSAAALRGKQGMLQARAFHCPACGAGAHGLPRKENGNVAACACRIACRLQAAGLLLSAGPVFWSCDTS